MVNLLLPLRDWSSGMVTLEIAIVGVSFRDEESGVRSQNILGIAANYSAGPARHSDSWLLNSEFWKKESAARIYTCAARATSSRSTNSSGWCGMRLSPGP